MAVLQKMQQTAMVPVFYNSDIEIAQNVVAACYAGGVRAFEYTNRGDHAHEVFAPLSKYVLSNCPDMALGAGSVVDAPTAALYIQMGACFIVGPMFNADVAEVCHRRCVPYIPGCGTVTEVSNAQAAGCDLCKIFPGDVLGPAFVKGLLAPMPWSKIMVTGGVEPSESNLAAWFAAGVCCVGMGSKLISHDMIAQKNWGSITTVCRDALTIIEKLRR